MSDGPAESRRWLDQHTVGLLRPERPHSPALRLVECNGQRMVAKTFLTSPAWYRETVGRFMLAREHAILEGLQRAHGVPRLYAADRPGVMLMEHIDGQPLEQLQPGQLPFEALEQARLLLEQVHAAGVAHCDLGHDFTGDFGRETNLIWDGQRLVLLDFAGSMRAWPTAAGRWFHEAMKNHDRLMLTKLVCRFFPDLDGHPFLDLPTTFPAAHWKLWRLLGKI
ncbi:MAG: hypothetical protein KC910_11910 [Candidatus Eremiobacteraeota bacterium]|nr:hypothetical protein [Candidatus Eremiobacteraeota bacterium]